MITEVSPTRYVIVVNGVRVGPPQASKQLAELEILKLPEDKRALAEVQVVSVDGKSLLLG